MQERYNFCRGKGKMNSPLRDLSFDLFFTESEKETLAGYKHDWVERSLVARLLQRPWDHLAALVPRYVAPNVLNLAGLICLLQAYYLCYMYMSEFPRAVTVACMFLWLSYQTLDAISGKHARNIRNDGPLGEMFQYCCSNVGIVFTSLTLCSIMGISKLSSMWYVVQTAQLVCLRKHAKAFRLGYVQTSLLGGEGELLWALLLLGLLRITFGLEWFNTICELGTTYTETNGLAITYYCLLAYSIYQVFTLPFGSRNGMIFCLLYRSLPAVLIMLNLYSSERTLIDIVCDGLFMSILTTELIAAKMAKRDLHPWVVLFAMASLFSNLLTLAIVTFYYATILAELALYLNLPLLSTVTNVYVDGIYDLCHLGHKRAFRNALKFGTRLLVGVINDKDATGYKRAPIMTAQERCDAVAACKYVHRVIPNAPCDGITPDFIMQHSIHVVAYGEEYDYPEDKYYKVAREMKIGRVLPRTKGMSTSELIRRIGRYVKTMDEETAAKEKARVEKDARLNTSL